MSILHAFFFRTLGHGVRQVVTHKRSLEETMQLKAALFVLGNWVQRELQCSGQEQEYFSCSITGRTLGVSAVTDRSILNTNRV